MPLLFAELGDTIIYVTDTAFLGRIGTDELAAIALVDVVIEICALPALGLIEAMQVMIARRFGERAEQALGQVFSRGMVLAVMASLLVTAGVKLGSPAATQALISSDQVAAAVDDFLQIGAYGIVPMAINFAYSSLYVAVGKPRVLIGATVILASTNLLLSYALVLGELGAPRLGMEGAGYAFVGAEVATFGYLTVGILRRRDLSRYAILRPRRWRTPLVRPLVRLSGPVALQGAVETGRWLIFFLVLEQAGEAALAGSSLVYACFAVLIIPADACRETAYSLVSRIIGEGQERQIGALIRRISGVAYVLTAPLLLLVAIWPDLALSLLSSESAAVDGARGAVRVVALGMIIAIPAEVWLGAVFGTGDADAALWIEVLLSGLVILGVGVTALVLDLDLEYVWMSVPAAALAALVIARARVRRGSWQGNAV